MFTIIKFDEEISRRMSNAILFVTATDVETEYLHKKISPLPQHGKILKISHELNTYYIGKFGNYAIVHVQCSSMGAVGRAAALTTLIDSINTWHPKAVLMVGIAYGIDKKNQNIGDVLISETVIPYEQRKITTTQIIQRNPIPEAGQILLNRFKNCKEWSLTLHSGNIAKKIPGHILSGEALIDNIDFTKELLRTFPAAKGGEMEGAGLYAAASSRKVDEWILVKGICDYADGKKSKNKKKNQIIAITTAVDLCEKVLSIDNIFDDIKITMCHFDQKVTSQDFINKILFSSYESSCEPYYIKRKIDDEFITALKFYGVWVFGPCGFGKTATLTRNLTINFGNYIFFDLSSCIGKTNDEIFYVVLLGLCDAFSISDPSCASNDQVLKYIVKILSENCSTDNKYIYFDELPIKNADQLEDFINKIVAINCGVGLLCNGKVIKFIMSTIENPKKYLLPTSKKISEIIKFIEISSWHTEDIGLLVNLIISQLNISIQRADLDKIIIRSQNNPRFVKCFFKNWLTLNENPRYSLDLIIADTEQQVFI